MGLPKQLPKATIWSWFAYLTDPDTPREAFWRGLALILVIGIALWPVFLLLMSAIRLLPWFRE